jgi:hypothetical protein
MGLTHRPLCVVDATIQQVASLGFDFNKTAPSREIILIPASTPALFKQGILFAADFNEKGALFLSFLALIKQKTQKVLFIDDKKKNVTELESTLTAHGIEVTAVHYTAIEHAKPIFIRELAEFQYKFLDQIMSNEAALLLMESGLD